MLLHYIIKKQTNFFWLEIDYDRNDNFKDNKFIDLNDIIKEVKNINLKVNNDVLPAYIQNGYIKAPNTIKRRCPK